MQRAEFETKLNRVCLHIYKEEHYEEDYQMPMLRQNRLEGILDVEGCEVGGKARYTYEVSGLTSMKTMYENTCIKKQEIEAVIARILEVTETLQRYMLNPNCLVLKPEYMFYKENHWYFCYFPGMEEDLCKLFHELTEYFVKMLDYQDTEGIFLAYELHKATLQEHYDLELIMKEYRNRESERKMLIRERQRNVRYRRESKEKSGRRPEGKAGAYRTEESVRYHYRQEGAEGQCSKCEGAEYEYGEQKCDGREYRKKQGTGYKYENRDDAGYEYGKQDSAGYKYGNRDSTGYKYGKQDSTGYKYGKQDSTGYKYENRDSAGYKYGNRDNVGYEYENRDSNAGYEYGDRDSAGYEYGKSDSAGYEYGKQNHAGYDFRKRGNEEYSYGGQEKSGYNYRTRKGAGYDYGTQESDGCGSIFSVADEDENEREQGRSIFDKPEQIQAADTIREDEGGGWWKSWRKAANGIRRKRWGSWEDLILETDGQEEES